MHVPTNIQVVTKLAKHAIAEVLLCEACVGFKTSLYPRWRNEEVHAEGADGRVRDYVDKARAVMLFAVTGMVESYKEGIT